MSIYILWQSRCPLCAWLSQPAESSVTAADMLKGHLSDTHVTPNVFSSEYTG